MHDFFALKLQHLAAYLVRVVMNRVLPGTTRTWVGESGQSSLLTTSQRGGLGKPQRWRPLEARHERIEIATGGDRVGEDRGDQSPPLDGALARDACSTAMAPDCSAPCGTMREPRQS